MKGWEEDDLFYSLSAPTFWTAEIDLFVCLILGGRSCAPQRPGSNEGHPSDWYCFRDIDISRTKKRRGMKWLTLDEVVKLRGGKRGSLVIWTALISQRDGSIHVN